MGQAVEKLFVVYQRWADAGSNKMSSGERMIFDRLSAMSEEVAVDNWMCRERMDHVFDAECFVVGRRAGSAAPSLGASTASSSSSSIKLIMFLCIINSHTNHGNNNL